jgi:hypothetical protein
MLVLIKRYVQPLVAFSFFGKLSAFLSDFPHFPTHKPNAASRSIKSDSCCSFFKSRSERRQIDQEKWGEREPNG